MNYREWKSESQKDYYGEQRAIDVRSSRLKAVDEAFEKYEAANSKPVGERLTKLKALEQALHAWKMSKAEKTTVNQYGKVLTGWQVASRRSTAAAALTYWIASEYLALGEFTKPESGWNNGHNCYAYAMKCKLPKGLGGNARPGIYGGSPADKEEQFINGILADAKIQGKTVTLLQQTVDPLPGQLTNATYLVALLAFGDGYHFLRRNETTQLWSHKNGASSDNETYAHYLPESRWVPLSNDWVAGLLANPADYMGTTPGIRFKAYLSVPDSGLMVAGSGFQKV